MLDFKLVTNSLRKRSVKVVDNMHILLLDRHECKQLRAPGEILICPQVISFQ